MNGQDIIKRLKAEGWQVRRQEGSHVRTGKGAAAPRFPCMADVT